MHRILSLALVLAACSDPALEARVKQLEDDVAEMKAAPPAAAPAPRPGTPPAQDPRNEEAIALFREANQLIQTGKYEEAKAKITKLTTDYAGTPAARSGGKLKAELDVIGKPMGPLNMDKWYQGETQMADSGTTLLVFWEVWCPHCKREVPKLETTHKEWGAKGLQVIGLTKQTRNITDEQVTSFMKDNAVTYPVGKEDGTVSQYYNVSGIPAAAVVKDGKVVWRGHPGRITDDMIAGWTGA